MSTTSWYRSTYWNMKGNREYTKAGYEAAAAKFDPTEMDVDCNGRHIMITGATRGLGLCTAQELAKRGAVLHLVCRDMALANTVRASIISDTGNDKIYLYQLDLSQPRAVLRFCSDFLCGHDQLHVLVNNAGVMNHERVLDEDGIESNFAVNTLAMHLLTIGLMPLLKQSDGSRVVNVASAGMLTVRLDPVDLSFENMQPFNGRLAYSQTKRQQVVLTLAYAQSFPDVHFSCMHPGWADTTALRTSLPQFYEMMKDKLRTPEQGADTIVWLVVSERAKKYNSGLFFQDREAVATHLPLAWTRTTVAEEKTLLDNLEQITTRLQQPRVSKNEPGQRQTDQQTDQIADQQADQQANQHADQQANQQSDQQGNQQAELQANQQADQHADQQAEQHTRSPNQNFRKDDTEDLNQNLTVPGVQDAELDQSSRNEVEQSTAAAHQGHQTQDTPVTDILFTADHESKGSADYSGNDSGIGARDSLSPSPLSDQLISNSTPEVSMESNDNDASEGSLSGTTTERKTVDVPSKLSSESAITAISENLESTKLEGSLKESTVS